MGEITRAFLLGNTAILTNVCLLPLYPGLIAFMIGMAASESNRRATKWLGLVVLAGVLSLMLVVGWLLYLLKASFGDILTVLLPIIYAVVALIGVLMIAGRNPFNRLGTIQAPVLRNPYAAAYVYGLLLGPMTLPCAGPIVLSAFLLGAGSIQALAGSLLYFVVFGLGFGWPLVVLPLIAPPLQRNFTGWMTRNYRSLTMASGTLLVLIAVFGFVMEVLPNTGFRQ
ncbi:MAG: cytochrome c biogenesis protein CcdA [Burkholderiaceae bacterium]